METNEISPPDDDADFGNEPSQLRQPLHYTQSENDSYDVTHEYSKEYDHAPNQNAVDCPRFLQHRRHREGEIVVPLISQNSRENSDNINPSTSRWGRNIFHSSFLVNFFHDILRKNHRLRRQNGGRHRGSDQSIDYPNQRQENNERSISTDYYRDRINCNQVTLGLISNLCSATLGAGALSLPYAFSLTGIIPGVLLLLLSAYATIISIDVIISSCVRTKLLKYEDVTVRLVGPRAGRVLESSLLVFCFGTAVAYIVAVGDILDQGIRSIPHFDNIDDENGLGKLILLYSRERVMILFWALVMFPLSLQRRVEGLQWVSLLGVLSIMFLVLAVVIHSISNRSMAGTSGNSSTTDPEHIVSFGKLLWHTSFWKIVRACPIIMFAFSCQVNVCAIFDDLRPTTMFTSPNLEDDTRISTEILKSNQAIMSSVTRRGIALCSTLYLLIGTFGYLDFSSATLDNILKNYCLPVTHNSLMIAASMFIALAVVVAFPLNILPARVTLELIRDRWNREQRSSTPGSNSNNACRFSGSSIRRLFNDHRVSFSFLTPRQSHQGQFAPETNSTESFLDSPPTAHYDGADVILIDGDTSATGLQPLLSDDFSAISDQDLLPHLSLSGNEADSSVLSFNRSPISSPLQHFSLTLFLSGSALIVALLVPDISILFGLMGGTASSIISFILPGFFLNNLTEESQTLDSCITESRSEEERTWIGSSEMPSVPSPPRRLLLSRSQRLRRQKLLARSFIWGGILIGVLSTGVTLHGLFRQNKSNNENSICGEDGISG